MAQGRRLTHWFWASSSLWTLDVVSLSHCQWVDCPNASCSFPIHSLPGNFSWDLRLQFNTVSAGFHQSHFSGVGKVSCAYPKQFFGAAFYLTLWYLPCDANHIHTNTNNWLGFYFVFVFNFWGKGRGLFFHLAGLIQALASVYINLFGGCCTTAQTGCEEERKKSQHHKHVERQLFAFTGLTQNGTICQF